MTNDEFKKTFLGCLKRESVGAKWYSNFSTIHDVQYWFYTVTINSGVKESF